MAKKEETRISVPAAWQEIDAGSLHGVVMVVGGPGSGKSTLSHWLLQQSLAAGKRTAFIDGDPGQSRLGPPTTVSLALGEPGRFRLSEGGNRWYRFIGATSPVRHMLPLISSAGRLAHTARTQQAETIIYDTTGLIDKRQGGLNLKLALCDLLQPSLVITIQKDNELRPLIEYLRRTESTRSIELLPCRNTRRRYMEERQNYRREKYERYFKNAAPVELEWTSVAVLPEPVFHRYQLMALEDTEGFVIGLGIIKEIDTKNERLTIISPHQATANPDTIRLGSLTLDPVRFEEQWL
jgi:polynucleotide 5'-hydroxyl-kinase GRC3/NOL9